MALKANNLAHTKWYCKYHIVFNPKTKRNRQNLKVYYLVPILDKFAVDM